MKAQRRLGLALAWLPSLVVFLIGVAIMVLVSNWPDAWRRDIAWWTGVGIAAAVALAVLLTYRGVPVGKLVVDWVRNFFTKVEPKLTAGRTPVIDHRRRYGRATVGLREDRGAVVAVVAVSAPVVVSSGRHSQPDVAETRLPVQAIADGLRQFDVHLDGIDIITVATGAAAPAKPRPGAWLVLRMNPERNVGAVVVRDSVASTMAAAAERIADDLGRRQIEAFPLTADELSELDTVVLAGLEPADSRVRLRFIKQSDGTDHPPGYVTSFWLSPKNIDGATLDQLGESDTDATVLTVRLRPRHGQVLVSAWVRYHSADRLKKTVWKGLNRLAGRQLPAVAASLPVPAPRSLRLPTRVLDDDNGLTVLLRQSVPASPVEAGQ